MTCASSPRAYVDAGLRSAPMWLSAIDKSNNWREVGENGYPKGGKKQRQLAGMGDCR